MKRKDQLEASQDFEVNKGVVPRSWLVVQEFVRGDPRKDLFSGTPHPFAARIVLTLSAGQRSSDVMALDVCYAFLYAGVDRELYTDVPSEDAMNMCGKYVGRPRPTLWQR